MNKDLAFSSYLGERSKKNYSVFKLKIKCPLCGERILTKKFANKFSVTGHLREHHYHLSDSWIESGVEYGEYDNTLLYKLRLEYELGCLEFIKDTAISNKLRTTDMLDVNIMIWKYNITKVKEKLMRIDYGRSNKSAV
jgi:hypothetical protein